MPVATILRPLCACGKPVQIHWRILPDGTQNWRKKCWKCAAADVKANSTKQRICPTPGCGAPSRTIGLKDNGDPKHAYLCDKCHEKSGQSRVKVKPVTPPETEQGWEEEWIEPG